MQNEHSLPLIDENNNSTMPVAPNVINQKRVNSNSNDNYKQMIWHHRFQQKHSATITSGYIWSKKCIQPILAKECLTETMIFKNEKAMKRKNIRHAARKLKEKRNIRYPLQKQIYELKSEQNYLLLHVENLRSYKQRLQIKFQAIRSVSKLIHRPK